MKNLFVAIALMVSISSFAQQPTELDKSPMDMSYWPNSYPTLKLDGKVKDQPVARIIYSRPQKNGRVIFNGVVKYKEVWRLGANESTEIEFFKPVKISGKTIDKGKYTLFCIPDSTSWTVIVNKDTYSWGSFAYNAKKDVVRITIPLQKTAGPIEAFTMYFEDSKNSANLIMLWDDVKATLPMSL
jgi:hypothetical protein